MRSAIMLSLVSMLACAPAGEAPVVQGPDGCEVLLDAGTAGQGIITAVAQSADGRLAWSEGYAGHVVRFEGQGGVHGVTGRDGDGPGEFRTVSRLGWRGDTLWVADARLGRITLLRRDGTPLATRDIPLPGAFVPVAGDTAVGTTPGAGPDDPVRSIVRVTGAGPSRLDTLLSVTGDSASMVEIEDGIDGYRMAERPFPERAFVSVSQDGRWACGVEPADGAGTVHLACRAPDGRALVDTLLALTGLAPTDADYASAVDRLAVTMPDVDRAAIEAGIPRPGQLPMTSALAVTGEGAIWIRRSSPRELAETWDRFQAANRRIDRFVLPAGHDLLSARGSVVLARAADSAGNQRVEACRVAAMTTAPPRTAGTAPLSPR